MAGRIKYLFTLALPLAAVGIGAAWMMGLGGFGGSGDSALAYETAEISQGDIRRLVTTSGPVRAVVTVSVGSQLSGRIDKLSADFNSEVKEGDLLALLDDKTFAARVAQARSDLVAAKAGLTNQEAARVKAEAMLRNAKRLLERQETLASKGVASTATLDTAIRDVDVAVADIAVIDAQIENAKATIEQREAALKVAEIDLERTRILSPIDGTVISRTVDVGQTVAASLQAPELFKIAQDLRRIQIEAQVNEADVGAIREGNPVEFTVDAYPEDRFRGSVSQVRLAATELQNVVTYTVIIEARNDDRRLYPGMTANVQIETARRHGVLRISNDALRFRPRELAAAPPQAGSAQAAERGERLLTQLRTVLKLNDEQAALVQDVMQKAAAARAERQKARQEQGEGSGEAAGAGENRAGNARGSGDVRNRFMERIEAVLEPTLTDEQKPLLERWRQARQGGRMATVWVMGLDRKPEQRQVRLGISDEQFAELIGGGLKQGDRVITRQRQVAKR
ncbi:MAG TPA: efflux RND transporter periplasmic adaptor subunit [Hyphomicrobiaceae bacterium]|nr:efflux RND transporter periplasmic adaptor subunit [Hyphomicrobiaceae bacterium]